MELVKISGEVLIKIILLVVVILVVLAVVRFMLNRRP